MNPGCATENLQRAYGPLETFIVMRSSEMREKGLIIGKNLWNWRLLEGGLQWSPVEEIVPKKNPTSPMSIYVDPETKAQIEAAAERENRTVSNWVLTVIKERLAGEARRDVLMDRVIHMVRGFSKTHAKGLESITDEQLEALMGAIAEISDTPKDDG